MKYLFFIFLAVLFSCSKETSVEKKHFVQTVQAEFTELDSTQSIVIKQTDMLGTDLSSQEYKLTSLTFKADMSIQNVKPSLFTMYLKDKDGNLSVLETRPLK
jgi:hypothetical protein